MPYILYIILGFSAGILSGIFGIGGGAIMIPAFVLLLGYSQHMAQGTSLAVMLPPVFILAAWRYYKEGNMNIPVAIWVALGLLLGAWVGAHFVQGVSDANLKRAFGIFLIVIGIKMALFK